MRVDFGGHVLSAIVPEGVSIPADAAIRFEPDALNVYVDSWLADRV